MPAIVARDRRPLITNGTNSMNHGCVYHYNVNIRPRLSLLRPVPCQLSAGEYRLASRAPAGIKTFFSKSRQSPLPSLSKIIDKELGFHARKVSDLILIANVITLRVANGKLPLINPLGANSIDIKREIDTHVRTPDSADETLLRTASRLYFETQQRLSSD